MTMSPNDNPFDRRLRTPTKPKTPVSDKSTPTSLVRNMFARNRSASVTPTKPVSKRSVYPSPNTVVLTPSKKSLGDWSPPPEDEDGIFNREESPSPTDRLIKTRKGAAPLSADVKPKLEELKAGLKDGDEMPLPPPQQVISSKSTASSGDASNRNKRRPPSPTLRNDPPTSTAVQSSETGHANGVEAQERPKKRVRMASLTPSNRRAGVVSQPTPISSGGTITSLPSVPTDDSGSTLATGFSKSAWRPRLAPPSLRDVTDSMESRGLPSVVYQEPFYSSALDVPPRAKMFAGRMFSLKGNGVGDLPDFELSKPETAKWLKSKRRDAEQTQFGWEFGLPPPTRKKVCAWCAAEDAEALEAGEL